MLSRAKGYGGHFLAQGIETPQLLHLIVRWQSLEDHTPGFEASEDHRMFMMGLQEYFSEEPRVYHIEGAAFASGEHDDPNSAVGMGMLALKEFVALKQLGRFWVVLRA